MSTLHPDRFFHTGIVVADIDVAMAELSRSLGVTWKGGWPAVHHLHYFGADQDVELRIAFSVQGPPHVELIEAKEDTLWPPESYGTHHLCYWSDDAVGDGAGLEAVGYERLSGIPGVGGGYFRSPSGVTVELLTADYHQRLVSWLQRPSTSSA
jgi:catechol 2,3-dioxygenase-like lactoylglutathione lyase family enzyme